MDANQTLQRKTLFVLLIGGSGLFLYMIRGFIMPLFLGALFAAMTYPVYRRIENRIKKKAYASLATLLIILLLVVFPLLLIGYFSYLEASSMISNHSLHEWIGGIGRGIQDLVHSPPSWLQPLIPDWLLSLLEGTGEGTVGEEVSGMAQKGVQYLFSGGAFLSKSLLSLGIAIGIMLFSMFYFYMDGPSMLQRGVRLLPLRDSQEKQLIATFVSTAKATMKGTLVIGMIQGSLGGVLLWAVGYTSPIFWSVVMAVLSILPGVGVFVVLLPAALILILEGSYLTGGIVVLCCTAIGLLDNVLRPWLIGKDLKMHDLVIVISTLGGIGLFGLMGFVVGPILASSVTALLHLYEEMYHNELDQNQRD
jgi:predicted PurR-regulated permease PerM